MPNLKAIRNRILSVKSTQKITKAMKMVAAAKLRRAQEAILATRPYAHRIDELIRGLSGEMEGYQHPMMLEHEEKKHLTIMIVTADRGLCGAFNANVVRRAEAVMAKKADEYETIELAIVGRRGYDYFKNKPVSISHYFKDVWKSTAYQDTLEASEILIDDYINGKTDGVVMIYNEFKSAIAQDLIVEELLPVRSLDTDGDGKTAADVAGHLYEPDRQAILEELVPQSVSMQVYRCFLESTASEMGARMTAMDGATKAAKEMIEKLTLNYNRARQAAITTELMEIVGGAEALKG